MKKTIDLTGFIAEDVDLKIGGKIYKVPTDPPVESYFELLNCLEIISVKKDIKLYHEAFKEFVVNMIAKYNNLDTDEKEELNRKFGVSALLQFESRYTDILLEKGILKKNLNISKKRNR